MKIFTSEQVRSIDAYTIENEPIASIDLMERASVQIASWMGEVFEGERPFAFLVGPGNNGGDGLAVARMLAGMNYVVEVFLIRISKKLSPDAAINLERLQRQGKVGITEVEDTGGIDSLSRFSADNPTAVLVDSIFGSGLTRKVGGLAADVISMVNSLPNLRVAIDMPSGLFGEDMRGNNPDAILKADYTLALQSPSLSFFFSENQEYTGIWEVLPIGLHPEILESEETQYRYLLPQYLSTLLTERKKFDHKGSYGHALLIAGCYGMMGAAVLAARACLRSGIGLVTSHVPRFGYQILQGSVPESLISIDQSDIMFSAAPALGLFSAVGVGPGLGCKPNSGKALKELIETVSVPMVIDADALNLLSSNPEWISLLPENTILTPHPKEFDRLFAAESLKGKERSDREGKSQAGYERHLLQIEFAGKHKLIIVLKGAHTSIAFPDGRCWFNTSGNPGMATAGSGDVLTGIILSLLAQGYSPGNSAMLGVYLHGLAADLAAETSSEESLIAGDIIESLGLAFQYLKGSRNETDT
ncbi:MAG TPA: NAD(P)H-hydrate dehydratase [Bacteroides sp.]|nr:NAD(P)H-hydrate dehydratase [Bacteroides sp.]